LRYDDNEDDFDDFGRRRPLQHPTSAGLIGFIFALVSAALLVVVLILYILLTQDEQQGQNVERRRFLMWFFLILDFLSFLTSLFAVITAGRGLSPSNPLYRGWAVTGLILGILELLITILFGFFMTCVVFITEVTRVRPGG
jgi:hypothetical protein